MGQTTRGCFITVEGSEGAGKSTNLNILSDVLSEHQIEFYLTREPGGTALAEELRELILRPREEPVDGLTELLMIFAARRQHVCNEILPRLAQGVWVVCDRFTDATYAYQGRARGIAEHYIDTLKAWVQEDLTPDLTLYFDVAPEVGAARIADRGHDRLEQEQKAFFNAVRSGYLDLAAKEARIQILDASQALEAVQEDVRARFSQFVVGQRST